MFMLKELRQQAGIKRSTMANELGINAGTIANYENGLREAPYEYLIKFAEYFDVTVDELLGRDPNATTLRTQPLNADERKLLEDYRACKYLGKSRISEFAELWRANDNEQPTR